MIKHDDIYENVFDDDKGVALVKEQEKKVAYKEELKEKVALRHKRAKLEYSAMEKNLKNTIAQLRDSVAQKDLQKFFAIGRRLALLNTSAKKFSEKYRHTDIYLQYEPWGLEGKIKKALKLYNKALKNIHKKTKHFKFKNIEFAHKDDFINFVGKKCLMSINNHLVGTLCYMETFQRGEGLRGVLTTINDTVERLSKEPDKWDTLLNKMDYVRFVARERLKTAENEPKEMRKEILKKIKGLITLKHEYLSQTQKYLSNLHSLKPRENIDLAQARTMIAQNLIEKHLKEENIFAR